MPRGNDARLLRSLVEVMAVVIVMGAIGVAVGIGLTTQFSDDTPATDEQPGVTKAATTTATTTIPVPTTSGGRLRVDIVSAVVHALTSTAGGTGGRARFGVHVRVTNNSERDFMLSPPVLFVGEERDEVAPASSATAGGLPAVLDVDDVVDTTLNFEFPSRSAEQLMTVPLVLRIATKNLTLVPVLGSTLRG